MLAALLLAGLAAAAIVPFALDGLSHDDDAGDDADAADGGSDVGKAAALDEALSQADEDADMSWQVAAEGAAYDIPAASDGAVLGAFDAGCDRCTVNVDTWDSEFTLTEGSDGEGASMAFTNAAGDVVTLRFPGLAEVPVDAITVRVEVPGEAGPVAMPLAEIFAASDAPDSDIPDDVVASDEAPHTVLSPTDPDAPDELPAPLDHIFPIHPVGPDTPAILPIDLWDGEALAPVLDDLPFHDPSLIHFDPVTGVPVPAAVDGFTADDVLSVTLSPAAASGPLDVTVTAAEGGAGAVVLIDGQPVAVVTGPAIPHPSQVHVSVAGKLTA